MELQLSNASFATLYLIKNIISINITIYLFYVNKIIFFKDKNRMRKKLLTSFCPKRCLLESSDNCHQLFSCLIFYL